MVSLHCHDVSTVNQTLRLHASRTWDIVHGFLETILVKCKMACVSSIAIRRNDSFACLRDVILHVGCSSTSLFSQLCTHPSPLVGCPLSKPKKSRGQGLYFCTYVSSSLFLKINQPLRFQKFVTSLDITEQRHIFVRSGPRRYQPLWRLHVIVKQRFISSFHLVNVQYNSLHSPSTDAGLREQLQRRAFTCHRLSQHFFFSSRPLIGHVTVSVAYGSGLVPLLLLDAVLEKARPMCTTARSADSATRRHKSPT